MFETNEEKKNERMNLKIKRNPSNKSQQTQPCPFQPFLLFDLQKNMIFMRFDDSFRKRKKTKPCCS